MRFGELGDGLRPRADERLREAQSIAAFGMNLVRAMLRPGIIGHEIATEVLYTMTKAGAEGASAPVHVNSDMRKFCDNVSG
ncbi:MAG: hypothetical protein LAO51_11180 [Acidobacteriia bacterium]|nr:hypothetical protein [Terriglobia bacterium]